MTINPPLYGADTPQSFFDEKLPYGWNLRDLEGCLLKRYDVPHIPGVTTPMTYFGMWKSFFSWHVVSGVCRVQKWWSIMVGPAVGMVLLAEGAGSVGVS